MTNWPVKLEYAEDYRLTFGAKQAPIYRLTWDKGVVDLSMLRNEEREERDEILEEFAALYRQNRQTYWWHKQDDTPQKIAFWDRGDWVAATHVLHTGRSGCADWTSIVRAGLESRGLSFWSIADIEMDSHAHPGRHQSAVMWPVSQTLTARERAVVLDPWIIGVPCIYSYSAWRHVIGAHAGSLSGQHLVPWVDLHESMMRDLKTLYDGNQQQRIAAVKRLGGMGTTARAVLPQLKARLESETDPHVIVNLMATMVQIEEQHGP